MEFAYKIYYRFYIRTKFNFLKLVIGLLKKVENEIRKNKKNASYAIRNVSFWHPRCLAKHNRFAKSWDE